MLSILTTAVTGMSLFMRTTWLAELPEAQWRSWFELIRRGRHEGPDSPFYVHELALQNVACCESHPYPGYDALGCLGPKCSALGLAPNSLLVSELDRLAEFFPLFDRVWVGSTTRQGWNAGNRTANREYAALQAEVLGAFMARYNASDGVRWGWYITEEGSLPGIGLDPAAAAGWRDFIGVTQLALDGVAPGLPFLWSPSNGNVRPNATQRVAQEAGLRGLFCDLPRPLEVHFQDYLGQSVTFDFPYRYDYSAAFTCEADTVPTVAMLKRVQEHCPASLLAAKVNAELFAERLSPDGRRGEDNGANIVTADPREVHDRLACYRKHRLDVGASWAINHWFALSTFANATVYPVY